MTTATATATSNDNLIQLDIGIDIEPFLEIPLLPDSPQQETKNLTPDDDIKVSEDRIAIHHWVTLERDTMSNKFKSPFPVEYEIPDFKKPDVYLSNPICMRYLVQFLSAEFAGENFRFLYQVELLKGLDDPEKLQKHVLRIFDNFISPKTANFEINIPNGVRNEITETLQGYKEYVEYLEERKSNASKPKKADFVVESLIFDTSIPERPKTPPQEIELDVHIFDDARRVIYNLIKTDSISRFVKTEKYPLLQKDLRNSYRTKIDEIFLSLSEYPVSNPLDLLYPGTGTVVVDLTMKNFKRRRRIHRKGKSTSDFFSRKKHNPKSKITKDLLNEGKHNLRSASHSSRKSRSKIPKFLTFRTSRRAQRSKSTPGFPASRLPRAVEAESPHFLAPSTATHADGDANSTLLNVTVTVNVTDEETSDTSVSDNQPKEISGSNLTDTLNPNNVDS